MPSKTSDTITSQPGPGGAPSGASSTGSPTTSAFVADAGPAFDAASAAEQPAPRPEPGAADVWDESQLRSILSAKGAVLHGLLAVEKESTEWSYTDADLDAIAPPLARILNRYDATRAAAAAGDELAVAVGFGGYALRSYGERKAALQSLAQERRRMAPRPQPAAPAPDAAAAVDPDELETPPLAGRGR